ncbi:hypothetical protein CXF85_15030 [Colwellia sp. 75C3]|nr:hypothetical protein CXF85_15030 [Colwellia sp. 75C3]
MSCEICHIRVSKCFKIPAILPFGEDINQQLCVFIFDVDQQKIITLRLDMDIKLSKKTKVTQ